MTHNSSAFVDPFADTEIQAAIAHLPSFAPRAKYLGMQRGTDIVSGDDIAAPVAISQCLQFVQQILAYVPDKTEQLLLTQIEQLGRSTPADLAPLIKRSVTWTTKRLAKLAAKQLVVGRPGRNGGYELVGSGQ